MAAVVKARLDLVGRAELLQLLGVSPTRLVQLTSRPEYDFPEPVAELIGGKIWLLDDVKAWAKTQGRTLHPLERK
jgi:prophage regulatory protein